MQPEQSPAAAPLGDPAWAVKQTPGRNPRVEVMVGFALEVKYWAPHNSPFLSPSSLVPPGVSAVPTGEAAFPLRGAPALDSEGLLVAVSLSSPVPVSPPPHLGPARPGGGGPRAGKRCWRKTARHLPPPRLWFATSLGEWETQQGAHTLGEEQREERVRAPERTARTKCVCVWGGGRGALLGAGVAAGDQRELESTAGVLL